MPELNLTEILSVSSEEKNFPADSLLQSGQFKKWKCKPSETKAVVIIKLEKSSLIEKIDIGNEGSAFIEVLVGRASLKEEDFQVILVASSFLSPAESKNAQNLNRVRMFGRDDLYQSVLSQKWDVVKVVCTQPFNKNIAYGLSFIKFYSPAEADQTLPQMSIGGFQMKISDSKSEIEVGSFFKKRNLPPTLTKKSIVSDIKEASKEASSANSFASVATTSKAPFDKTNPLKRSQVSNENNDLTKTSDESRAIHSKETGRNNYKDDKSKDKSEKKLITKNDDTPPVKKIKYNTKEEESSSAGVVFKDIMKGVIFAMSGFQNPLRGLVRDKAVEMGAKYKADWDGDCTHLICAFENTPKFSQVNGKGIIVKKDWIENCHKQKTLLPWRNFRLGRAKSPSSRSTSSSAKVESLPNSKPDLNNSQVKSHITNSTNNKINDACKNDDIDKIFMGPDITSSQHHNKPLLNQHDKQPSQKYYKPPLSQLHDKPLDQQHAKTSQQGEPRASTSTNIYDKETDSENDDNDDSQKDSNKGSEIDTEEELLQFNAKEKKLENIELNGDEIEKLPELPDLFTNKRFFLYGKFSEGERRLFKRYIIAYNGKLLEYMDDKVNFVITNDKWDDNFDEALSENSNLIFVRPSWLTECSELQKLTPFQKHIVSAT